MKKSLVLASLILSVLAGILTAIDRSGELAHRILALVPALKGQRYLVLLGMAALEFGAIVYLVGLSPKTNSRREPAASSAVEALHGVWRIFWVFMFAIVILSIVVEAGWLGNAVSSIAPVVITALSFGTTLLQALCYTILLQPRSDPKYVPWEIVGFVYVALIGLMLAATCGTGPAKWIDLATVNALDGLSSAVVLALFVGRMESILLRIPIPAIILLYASAAIQLPWATLDLNHRDLVLSTLINIAAIPRWILFYYVYKTLADGRMLTYFAKVRDVRGFSRKP